MEIVVGIDVSYAPRLLDSLHVPLLPSLNEIAIGVLASSVRVAQPVITNASRNVKKIFGR